MIKNYIGITGLIIGIIAVGIAIFQGNIRDVVSPPKPVVQDERTIQQLAMEAGKKILADKLREMQKDPVPQLPSTPEKSRIFAGVSDEYDSVAMVYAVMGFIAMVLGIVSWMKKDHIRISGGAISLGLMAVAWQYVLVGVTIAIIILIIANLSA
jgi:hypothetical protein